MLTLCPLMRPSLIDLGSNDYNSERGPSKDHSISLVTEYLLSQSWSHRGAITFTTFIIFNIQVTDTNKKAYNFVIKTINLFFLARL